MNETVYLRSVKLCFGVSQQVQASPSSVQVAGEAPLPRIVAAPVIAEISVGDKDDFGQSTFEVVASIQSLPDGSVLVESHSGQMTRYSERWILAQYLSNGETPVVPFPQEN